LPRSRKRYFSGDDSEIGVTPSQLKRLGKAKQLEYLIHWFGRMFEDPANETPHNSEEGGYQYIWGGPYDARDELDSEFGHLVSEEIIEQAVSQVEEHAVEWAPGPEHPDHARAAQEYAESQRDGEGEGYDLGFDLKEIEDRLERGLKPQYGDDWETRRRRQILRDLDELQFMLPKGGRHGGLGHNQPPSDQRITEEESARAFEAIDVIRIELEKVEPDAKAVVESTGWLQSILQSLAKHLDTATGEFATNFGRTAGIAAGTAVGAVIGTGLLATATAAIGVGDDLVGRIGGVVQSLGEWLSHVTLPF
jgi:hypothetical protein